MVGLTRYSRVRFFLLLSRPQQTITFYNSLFKATTTTGNGHTIEALPIDRTLEILKAHNVVR